MMNKMFYFYVLTTLLLASFGDSQADAGHDMELQRSEVGTQIPKPISDHTASLGQDNLIYIAGGCDDPNGNTFDANSSYYTCGSISDSFFSFDPTTEEFATLPNMPRPRYRHASVAVNNQVWILGGRSLEDELLQDVDIFDVASQSWSSFMLPEGYASSDLGSWGTETKAYFVGGYDAGYTALSKVFSLDVTAYDGSSSAPPSIMDHGNLIEARGDVAATVNLDTGYAYVSGGFTHVNDFCEPLESVERYSLDGDTWISIASLPTARADKVMVSYKGHIVSMGGERQEEGICEIDSPEPGELAMTVDDIEVLNDDETTWQILSALPESRFRFAAVVYEDTIYTFGGQEGYDEACNCLKTTDEVVTYIDVSAEDDHDHEHDDGDEEHNSEPNLEDGSSAVTDDSGAIMSSSLAVSAVVLLVIGALA